jgi:glycosyltransferase involved in cell wall biosynthesis
MKIALIGTRGIPASHGGFETCVEEIGSRLVEKGHEVVVYSKFPKPGVARLKEYKGMKIVYIPRLPLKGLETLYSTFLSVIHTLIHPCDFYMVFNGANSPALLPYKLLKKHFALNTDGLEWQREKWGFLGRNYYKMSERVSVWMCKNLVSDSYGIYDYYKKKYNAESTTIAYGANIPVFESQEKDYAILKQYGLESKKYFLQVTRFEPENNPLLVLEGYINSHISDHKFVLVGGSAFDTEYSQKICKICEDKKSILLPGFIYDNEILDVLWRNCYGYVHGNGVGGTNPALLQAMASGRPIMSFDCNFNRCTLNDHALFFQRTEESVSQTMRDMINNPELAESNAILAFNRVKKEYNWPKITDQYEALFYNIKGIKHED